MLHPLGKPIRIPPKSVPEAEPRIDLAVALLLVAHDSRETPKKEKTEETEKSEMRREASVYWSVATSKRGIESREYADCHRRTKCRTS